MVEDRARGARRRLCALLPPGVAASSSLPPSPFPPPSAVPTLPRLDRALWGPPSPLLVERPGEEGEAADEGLPAAPPSGEEGVPGEEGEPLLRLLAAAAAPSWTAYRCSNSALCLRSASLECAWAITRAPAEAAGCRVRRRRAICAVVTGTETVSYSPTPPPPPPPSSAKSPVVEKAAVVPLRPLPPLPLPPAEVVVVVSNRPWEGDAGEKKSAGSADERSPAGEDENPPLLLALKSKAPCAGLLPPLEPWTARVGEAFSEPPNWSKPAALNAEADEEEEEERPWPPPPPPSTLYPLR